MRVIVLGSAAGGGVPQWNCRCRVCDLARAGDSRVLPRTQSGLAVTVDGESWLLVNASPDLGEQVRRTPDLHPRRSIRHSPIAAVLPTSAEIDHVAGLLALREGHAFRLAGAPETLVAIDRNPIFSVLAEDRVPRLVLQADVPAEILPGLQATLVPVPGKEALWQEGEVEAGTAPAAVMLAGRGRTLACVPGCAAVTPALLDRLDGVDALLFDGTVFHDDDIARARAGTKTGSRMGHLPMAGPDGSLAALAGMRAGQRIFIHLNNTNPVLVDGSPEREAVTAAGWIVAHDGMVVEP